MFLQALVREAYREKALRAQREREAEERRLAEEKRKEEELRNRREIAQRERFDTLVEQWQVAQRRRRFLVALRESIGEVAVTAQEFFTRLDKDTFAAIDMPSGLPVSRPRACDLEARRVLSPHGARVFPAPARAALGATDYRECCALNLTALNTKLSKQSHALLSKIREVDDLMSPELQMRIREAHPEVTFATLAGHSLKHSKKVVAGNIERWDILAKSDLWIDPSRMDSLREIDAALDDVLDAAACLLTAKRISEGRERVLGDRALDAKGLRMEIVA